MSTEPPKVPVRVCANCGASNYAFAHLCFLCRASLAESADKVNPYAQVSTANAWTSSATAQQRVETVFLILLSAIALLAVIIGIGIGTQDSGVLTLYLFVTVPALAAAGVQALYSVAKGETPRPSRMFMAFIWSAVVTAGVIALLIIGSVLFLFLMCARMFSGSGPL